MALHLLYNNPGDYQALVSCILILSTSALSKYSQIKFIV